MRGKWGASVVLAGLLVSLWSCSSECGCVDPQDLDGAIPGDDVQNDTAVPPDVSPDLEPGDLQPGELVDSSDAIPQPEDVQPMLPCLKVTPAEVHFGALAPGMTNSFPVELSVCPFTTLPVEISEIKLASGEGFSPEFALDLSGIGDFPLVLSPGETAEFLVQYTPQDGLAGSGVGEVQILSNAAESPLTVPVDVLSQDACPKAMPTVDEGTDVAPLSTIHLSGVDSYSTDSTIASYSWSVTSAPAGAEVVMIPNQAFSMPAVDLPLAGAYAFSLDVTDASGVQSCIPGTVEVMATPSQAVYVELLWDVEPDPGQEPNDEWYAADLDLHVAHPSANMPDIDQDGLPDPWFDPTYDCYEDNPTPGWGQDGAPPSAKLLASSPNGTWPEAVGVEMAGGSESYQVGVFYKDPSPYNSAHASIRVWVYGILVYAAEDVELNPRDMWHVCTIEWPFGKVTAVPGQEGGYKITPIYDNI